MSILLTVTSVVLYLAMARGSNSKFVKTAPTITNSLVNLGKMEISFYLNGKQPDESSKRNPQNSFISPPSKPHSMEPCPCMRNSRESTSFLSNPSEIISKILKSNDLFRDPTFQCCDSHEQIEENTVFFDISPSIGNRAPMIINNLKKPTIPRVPFPFQKFLNPPSLFPIRKDQKAMEIFLFPKRRDLGNFDYNKQPFTKATMTPKYVPTMTKLAPIPEIMKVGDKVVKPLNTEGVSVKKDLTSLLENKGEMVVNEDDLKTEMPGTSVNNAL